MTILRKLAISALVGTCALSAAAQDKERLDPNDKIRYAEAFIERLYVDEVNADSIVEQGIIAMLKTLDPHSQYSNAEETKQLNEPLEGKFSGIGVQFNMSTDTVYVIQTISGGPSEKVGIRPGDRIVAADGEVIAGKKLKNTDVMKVLRGPKGSKVCLSIKRGSSPELIDFIVVRDDIPVESVDAAYMVNPTTGYISLTRFAEDTGKEVEDAIRKLQAQGMKNLIFDLQNNGGGYLNAAVDVASLFLEKGDMVVYTHGRAVRDAEYHADRSKPLFTGPLVILVDQYSASASEILSGALQDNDRALIVGRRTFGKGLVQRPLPLPDGSMIRLTVARYYTPVGRSIQKHYEKGHSEDYARDMIDRYESGELWSADSIHFDESQKYATLKKGRTVYGGGGIMPDVFVPLDTTYNTSYYRDLVAKNVLYPYILGYIDSHRAELTTKYPDQDTFFEKFTVPDELVDGLAKKGEEAGVPINEAELHRSLPLLKASMKGLLARDLYQNGIYVRATNELNPIFREGVRQIEEGNAPRFIPSKKR